MTSPDTTNKFSVADLIDKYTNESRSKNSDRKYLTTRIEFDANFQNKTRNEESIKLHSNNHPVWASIQIIEPSKRKSNNASLKQQQHYKKPNKKNISQKKKETLMNNNLLCSHHNK